MQLASRNKRPSCVRGHTQHPGCNGKHGILHKHDYMALLNVTGLSAGGYLALNLNEGMGTTPTY
jgi:hypothetical protein